MTLEHLHNNNILFNQVNKLVTMSSSVEDTYKKLVSMGFVDLNEDIWMNNLNFCPSIPGVSYKKSAGLFVCQRDILHMYKIQYVTNCLIRNKTSSMLSHRLDIPENYEKIYRLGININNMNFFTYKIYNADSSTFKMCINSTIDWYKKKGVNNCLYVEDIEEFFRYLELIKFDKNLI